MEKLRIEAPTSPPLPYKRKDRSPSLDMHPPEGEGASYRCAWLDDAITIHSDGNVSCGLDDPHAMRSFGNVGDQPVAEIFANPEYAELQRKLAEGYRCRGCHLYAPAPAQSGTPAPRPALPSTIIVETTVRCNLRCPNQACIPNNDPAVSTRDAPDLDVEHFHSVVDQLQNSLKYLYFFNYGDPFMHRHAEDMLLHVRERCPDVEVVTSTNAIPLARPLRAEKVVASQVDRIVVTLSGIDQASYEKYHVNGRVALALKGLENLCRARRDHGTTRTRIVWRYLLFRWNDGIEEIERALALSKEFGVDQFSLYLTHLPADAASYRMAPGSPGYARFQDYIDVVHGYPVEPPSEDGFYRTEHIEEVGEVRWASSSATIDLAAGAPYLRLTLATVERPGSGGAGRVDVVTPWGTVAAEVTPAACTTLMIRVPLRFRRMRGFRIGLETREPWYPAEALNDDLRCLGVLLKTEDHAAGGWRLQLRWLRDALRPSPKLDRHRSSATPAARHAAKTYSEGGRLAGFGSEPTLAPP